MATAFTYTYSRGQYRDDGVRITHGPNAPGMASKDGNKRSVDPDGFDPQCDEVGAGIYGGNVRREANGTIVIGRQYQNHNARPGPVYAGTGYSEMSQALHKGSQAVQALLARQPTLAHEVSTGGATPLHMCGMSARNQLSTALLIAAGGDVEAEDTYGFRPLHRMASNNLAVGAKALIEAGAGVNARVGPSGGHTPLRIATQVEAREVMKMILEAGGRL
jgi:ankyrin repeat protein